MKKIPLLPKIFLTTLTLVYLSTNVVFVHAAETNFWEERKKQVHSPKSMVHGQKKSNQFARLIGPRPSAIPHSPTVNKINFPNYGPRTMHHGRFSGLAQFGSIRKITPGSSNRTIIHIQDIHMNSEAQENIGKTIQHLIDQDKVDLVALEGAFDVLDINKLRSLPNQTPVHMVADYLFEQNKISGPILTALKSKKSIPAFVGVDDAKLYEAHVAAVRESYPLKEKNKAALRKRKTIFDKKKRVVFSQDLLHFDSLVTSYRREEKTLGEHAQLLDSFQYRKTLRDFVKAYELEQSLNFSRVEHERTFLLKDLVAKLDQQEVIYLMNQSLAFHSGKINHADFYSYIQRMGQRNDVSLSRYPAMQDYLQYVLLSNSIDAQKLYEDLREVEAHVYESLAKTEEEKQLIKEGRHFYLANKLLDFALTKEEWGEYKSVHSAKSIVHNNSMNSFEDFYFLAENRDQAITQNLLSAIEETKAEAIVLVTGGFHSKGIQKILKKKEWGRINPTLVSFVPKLLKTNTLKGSEYLSIFAQEKTPLDKLFAGEKLFLAQKVMPTTSSLTALVFVVGTALNRKASELSHRLGNIVFKILLSPNLKKIRNVVLVPAFGASVGMMLMNMANDPNVSSLTVPDYLALVLAVLLIANNWRWFAKKIQAFFRGNTSDSPELQSYLDELKDIASEPTKEKYGALFSKIKGGLSGKGHVVLGALQREIYVSQFKKDRDEVPGVQTDAFSTLFILGIYILDLPVNSYSESQLHQFEAILRILQEKHEVTGFLTVPAIVDLILSILVPDDIYVEFTRKRQAMPGTIGVRALALALALEGKHLNTVVKDDQEDFQLASEDILIARRHLHEKKLKPEWIKRLRHGLGLFFHGASPSSAKPFLADKIWTKGSRFNLYHDDDPDNEEKAEALNSRWEEVREKFLSSIFGDPENLGDNFSDSLNGIAEETLDLHQHSTDESFLASWWNWGFQIFLLLPESYSKYGNFEDLVFSPKFQNRGELFHELERLIRKKRLEFETQRLAFDLQFDWIDESTIQDNFFHLKRVIDENQQIFDVAGALAVLKKVPFIGKSVFRIGATEGLAYANLYFFLVSLWPQAPPIITQALPHLLSFLVSPYANAFYLSFLVVVTLHFIFKALDRKGQVVEPENLLDRLWIAVKASSVAMVGVIPLPLVFFFLSSSPVVFWPVVVGLVFVGSMFHAFENKEPLGKNPWMSFVNIRLANGGDDFKDFRAKLEQIFTYIASTRKLQNYINVFYKNGTFKEEDYIEIKWMLQVVERLRTFYEEKGFADKYGPFDYRLIKGLGRDTGVMQFLAHSKIILSLPERLWPSVFHAMMIALHIKDYDVHDELIHDVGDKYVDNDILFELAPVIIEGILSRDKSLDLPIPERQSDQTRYQPVSYRLFLTWVLARVIDPNIWPGLQEPSRSRLIGEEVNLRDEFIEKLKTLNKYGFKIRPKDVARIFEDINQTDWVKTYGLKAPWLATFEQKGQGGKRFKHLAYNHAAYIPTSENSEISGLEEKFSTFLENDAAFLRKRSEANRRKFSSPREAEIRSRALSQTSAQGSFNRERIKSRFFGLSQWVGRASLMLATFLSQVGLAQPHPPLLPQSDHSYSRSYSNEEEELNLVRAEGPASPSTDDGNKKSEKNVRSIISEYYGDQPSEFIPRHDLYEPPSISSQFSNERSFWSKYGSLILSLATIIGTSGLALIISLISFILYDRRKFYRALLAIEADPQKNIGQYWDLMKILGGANRRWIPRAWIVRAIKAVDDQKDLSFPGYVMFLSGFHQPLVLGRLTTSDSLILLDRMFRLHFYGNEEQQDMMKPLFTEIGSYFGSDVQNGMHSLNSIPKKYVLDHLRPLEQALQNVLDNYGFNFRFSVTQASILEGDQFVKTNSDYLGMYFSRKTKGKEKLKKEPTLRKLKRALEKANPREKNKAPRGPLRTARSLLLPLVLSSSLLLGSLAPSYSQQPIQNQTQEQVETNQGQNSELRQKIETAAAKVIKNLEQKRSWISDEDRKEVVGILKDHIDNDQFIIAEAPQGVIDHPARIAKETPDQITIYGDEFEAFPESELEVIVLHEAYHLLPSQKPTMAYAYRLLEELNQKEDQIVSDPNLTEKFKRLFAITVRYETNARLAEMGYRRDQARRARDDNSEIRYLGDLKEKMKFSRFYFTYFSNLQVFLRRNNELNRSGMAYKRRLSTDVVAPQIIQKLNYDRFWAIAQQEIGKPNKKNPDQPRLQRVDFKRWQRNVLNDKENLKIPEEDGGKLKTVAFNSHLISLVLVSLSWWIGPYLGLTVSWQIAISLFVSFKISLLIFVLLHEAAHLGAQKQFKYLSFSQRLSLVLSSLNREPTLLKILLGSFWKGTDISNAFVDFYMPDAVMAMDQKIRDKSPWFSGTSVNDFKGRSAKKQWLDWYSARLYLSMAPQREREIEMAQDGNPSLQGDIDDPGTAKEWRRARRQNSQVTRLREHYNNFLDLGYVRQYVRWVAFVGPLVNFSGAVLGVALYFLPWFISFVGLPGLPQAPFSFASIVLAGSNLSLLLMNIRGTDYSMIATGRLHETSEFHLGPGETRNKIPDLKLNEKFEIFENSGKGFEDSLVRRGFRIQEGTIKDWDLLVYEQIKNAFEELTGNQFGTESDNKSVLDIIDVSFDWDPDASNPLRVSVTNPGRLDLEALHTELPVVIDRLSQYRDKLIDFGVDPEPKGDPEFSEGLPGVIYTLQKVEEIHQQGEITPQDTLTLFSLPYFSTKENFSAFYLSGANDPLLSNSGGHGLGLWRTKMMSSVENGAYDLSIGENSTTFTLTIPGDIVSDYDPRLVHTVLQNLSVDEINLIRNSISEITDRENAIAAVYQVVPREPHATNFLNVLGVAQQVEPSQKTLLEIAVEGNLTHSEKVLFLEIFGFAPPPDSSPRSGNPIASELDEQNSPEPLSSDEQGSIEHGIPAEIVEMIRNEEDLAEVFEDPDSRDAKILTKVFQEGRAITEVLFVLTPVVAVRQLEYAAQNYVNRKEELGEIKIEGVSKGRIDIELLDEEEESEEEPAELPSEEHEMRRKFLIALLNGRDIYKAARDAGISSALTVKDKMKSWGIPMPEGNNIERMAASIENRIIIPQKTQPYRSSFHTPEASKNQYPTAIEEIPLTRYGIKSIIAEQLENLLGYRPATVADLLNEIEKLMSQQPINGIRVSARLAVRAKAIAATYIPRDGPYPDPKFLLKIPANSTIEIKIDSAPDSQDKKQHPFRHLSKVFREVLTGYNLGQIIQMDESGFSPEELHQLNLALSVFGLRIGMSVDDIRAWEQWHNDIYDQIPGDGRSNRSKKNGEDPNDSQTIDSGPAAAIPLLIGKDKHGNYSKFAVKEARPFAEATVLALYLLGVFWLATHSIGLPETVLESFLVSFVLFAASALFAVIFPKAHGDRLIFSDSLGNLKKMTAWPQDKKNLKRGSFKFNFIYSLPFVLLPLILPFITYENEKWMIIRLAVSFIILAGGLAHRRWTHQSLAKGGPAATINFGSDEPVDKLRIRIQEAIYLTQGDLVEVADLIGVSPLSMKPLLKDLGIPTPKPGIQPVPDHTRQPKQRPSPPVAEKASGSLTEKPKRAKKKDTSQSGLIGEVPQGTTGLRTPDYDVPLNTSLNVYGFVRLQVLEKLENISGREMATVSDLLESVDSILTPLQHSADRALTPKALHRIKAVTGYYLDKEDGFPPPRFLMKIETDAILGLSFNPHMMAPMGWSDAFRNMSSRVLRSLKDYSVGELIRQPREKFNPSVLHQLDISLSLFGLRIGMSHAEVRQWYRWHQQVNRRIPIIEPRDYKKPVGLLEGDQIHHSLPNNVDELLLQYGIDPTKVQKLVGHLPTNDVRALAALLVDVGWINLTEKYELHLIPENDATALAALVFDIGWRSLTGRYRINLIPGVGERSLMVLKMILEKQSLPMVQPLAEKRSEEKKVDSRGSQGPAAAFPWMIELEEEENERGEIEHFVKHESAVTELAPYVEAFFYAVLILVAYSIYYGVYGAPTDFQEALDMSGALFLVSGFLTWLFPKAHGKKVIRRDENGRLKVFDMRDEDHKALLMGSIFFNFIPNIPFKLLPLTIPMFYKVEGVWILGILFFLIAVLWSGVFHQAFTRYQLAHGGPAAAISLLQFSRIEEDGLPVEVETVLHQVWLENRSDGGLPLTEPQFAELVEEKNPGVPRRLIRLAILKLKTKRSDEIWFLDQPSEQLSDGGVLVAEAILKALGSFGNGKFDPGALEEQIREKELSFEIFSKGLENNLAAISSMVVTLGPVYGENPFRMIDFYMKSNGAYDWADGNFSRSDNVGTEEVPFALEDLKPKGRGNWEIPGRPRSVRASNVRAILGNRLPDISEGFRNYHRLTKTGALAIFRTLINRENHTMRLEDFDEAWFKIDVPSEVVLMATLWGTDKVINVSVGNKKSGKVYGRFRYEKGVGYVLQLTKLEDGKLHWNNFLIASKKVERWEFTDAGNVPPALLEKLSGDDPVVTKEEAHHLFSVQLNQKNPKSLMKGVSKYRFSDAPNDPRLFSSTRFATKKKYSLRIPSTEKGLAEVELEHKTGRGYVYKITHSPINEDISLKWATYAIDGRGALKRTKETDSGHYSPSLKERIKDPDGLTEREFAYLFELIINQPNPTDQLGDLENLKVSVWRRGARFIQRLRQANRKPVALERGDKKPGVFHVVGRYAAGAGYIWEMRKDEDSGVQREWEPQLLNQKADIISNKGRGSSLARNQSALYNGPAAAFPWLIQFDKDGYVINEDQVRVHAPYGEASLYSIFLVVLLIFTYAINDLLGLGGFGWDLTKVMMWNNFGLSLLFPIAHGRTVIRKAPNGQLQRMRMRPQDFLWLVVGFLGFGFLPSLPFTLLPFINELVQEQFLVWILGIAFFLISFFIGAFFHQGFTAYQLAYGGPAASIVGPSNENSWATQVLAFWKEKHPKKFFRVQIPASTGVKGLPMFVHAPAYKDLIVNKGNNNGVFVQIKNDFEHPELESLLGRFEEWAEKKGITFKLSYIKAKIQDHSKRRATYRAKKEAGKNKPAIAPVTPAPEVKKKEETKDWRLEKAQRHVSTVKELKLHKIQIIFESDLAAMFGKDLKKGLKEVDGLHIRYVHGLVISFDVRKAKEQVVVQALEKSLKLIDDLAEKKGFKIAYLHIQEGKSLNLYADRWTDKPTTTTKISDFDDDGPVGAIPENGPTPKDLWSSRSEEIRSQEDMIQNLVRGREVKLGVGHPTIRFAKTDSAEEIEKQIQYLRGIKGEDPKVLILQNKKLADSYDQKIDDIDFVSETKAGVKKLHEVLFGTEKNPNNEGVGSITALIARQHYPRLKDSIIVTYLNKLEEKRNIPIRSYLTIGFLKYLIGVFIDLTQLQKRPQINWKRFTLIRSQA